MPGALLDLRPARQCRSFGKSGELPSMARRKRDGDSGFARIIWHSALPRKVPMIKRTKTVPHTDTGGQVE